MRPIAAFIVGFALVAGAQAQCVLDAKKGEGGSEVQGTAGTLGAAGGCGNTNVGGVLYPKAAGVKIFGSAADGCKAGATLDKREELTLHGRRGERIPEGRVRQGRRLGQEDPRHEAKAWPERSTMMGAASWCGIHDKRVY